MTIITGKGSEDRACAAQKKEEKSAQTSRKGVTVEVCCIFISVYAFSILIYCVPRSIPWWHGISNFGIPVYCTLTVYFEHFKLFSNSLNMLTNKILNIDGYWYSKLHCQCPAKLHVHVYSLTNLYQITKNKNL